MKEASKRYGIPTGTIYYLVETGVLPRVQLAPRRFFLKEKDIQRLIDENYGHKKQIDELMIINK